jgi:hypothetical protein
MGSPSITKLFISYAWKDDQPFVEHVYKDLQRLGYDPWMDTQNMPSRGRSLPREVEEQLQYCDRVIAVMGPAALTSEACRNTRGLAASTKNGSADCASIAFRRPSVRRRSFKAEEPRTLGRRFALLTMEGSKVGTS